MIWGNTTLSEPHNPRRDRELGMDRPISRRDFIDGVAVAIGAASLLPQSAEAATVFPQDRPGYDPPTLMGMRGSHDGSYDYAHALRDGDVFKNAGAPTDTDRRTILLSWAAGSAVLPQPTFIAPSTNPSAKILILDNHDDFGGHAKRNEFRPDGRLFITNGGTAGIESPFDYSKEASELLTDLASTRVALGRHRPKLAIVQRFAGLQNAYLLR